MKPSGNSDEHRKIAGTGTILRCLVGSGLHGISVSDQDDRDEMGVCTEPPEYVIGLQAFEQYEHHTAWERPGGRANRSGPGDLDITVYSLRKYVRLALAGNPTVLLPLFAPPEHVVECTPLYQGITLMRGLTLGGVGPALLWPVLYLGVMGVLGLALAGRRLDRLLLR